MLIYLVRANSDLTEGAGPMVDVCITKDRLEAVNMAMNNPGVMGCKGRQHQCNKPSYYLSWLGHRKTHNPWMQSNIVLAGTTCGTQIVEGDWEVIEFDI